MDLIKNQMSKITGLCRKYKVKELYLFGSALSHDFGQQSDIDLAVVFSRTSVAGSFDQYFDFKFDLENLLSRPVDLLCENSIRNTTFRQELNTTKKLIYAA